MKLRSSVLVALLAAAITLLAKNYYDQRMEQKELVTPACCKVALDLSTMGPVSDKFVDSESILNMVERVSTETLVDKSFRDLAFGKDANLDIQCL